MNLDVLVSFKKKLEELYHKNEIDYSDSLKIINEST